MKDIDFNLELWQSGEYDVFTVGGKEVTQLTYFDVVENDFCMAGVMENKLDSWYDDGSYSQKGKLGDFTLKLRPKAKTTWINIYMHNKTGLPMVCREGAFLTENDAKKYAGSLELRFENPLYTYLKTIPITNEPE